VLVTHAEAEGYCAWRGAEHGETRRLPTSAEYEKAARGEGGFAYPWGSAYEASKLNSAVQGPRDTTPVGTYADGASPFGVLDLAGNVFHWTSTPAPDEPGEMVEGWRKTSVGLAHVGPAMSARRHGSDLRRGRADRGPRRR
jgi:formylglycine-generating enzyme required for sulfatase activity